MPAENMVNTNELRFVKRVAAINTFQISSRFILQQRWVVIGTERTAELDASNSEWRDVPLVEVE